MYEWKKVILNSSDTMSKAIQVLNEEALRIIMVADHTNKLIGTITDGDIRRSLLLNMGLDTKLMNIMHKNPKNLGLSFGCQNRLLSLFTKHETYGNKIHNVHVCLIESILGLGLAIKRYRYYPFRQLPFIVLNERKSIYPTPNTKSF